MLNLWLCISFSDLNSLQISCIWYLNISFSCFQGALYESPHSDENDVQTISHKCRVMSFTRYKSYRQEHSSSDLANVYYLAGYYDPTISLIKFEGDVKLIWGSKLRMCLIYINEHAHINLISKKCLSKKLH